MRQKRLSDAARITHVETLCYLYTVEQDDCVFYKDMLPVMAASQHRDSAAAELVRAGYWRDLGDRFEVLDHGEVLRQSLTAQHKKLDRDRRAQASARARADRAVSADVITSNGDDLSDGADRQSDSRYEEDSQVVPLPRASGEPWPAISPPGGRGRDSWRTAAKGYDR